MRRANYAKRLPKCTLSELTPATISRHGYYTMLRSVTFALASEGFLCNVYFYVHAAADYQPVQGQFNWENAGQPFWILRTGYRELARALSGRKAVHPQTVKRALRDLHAAKLIELECDRPNRVIGIRYNGDFIRSLFHECDKLTKTSVTPETGTEAAETTRDLSLLSTNRVTACDSNMRESVTPWYSTDLAKIVSETFNFDAPGVTVKNNLCDTKGKGIGGDKNITPTPKLVEKEGAKLIDGYLASLKDAARKVEINKMLRLTEQRRGHVPWARSEVQQAFRVIYGNGAHAHLGGIFAILEAKGHYLRSVVAAYYRQVRPGEESEAYRGSLARFQSTYPSEAARKAAMEKLKADYRPVIGAAGVHTASNGFEWLAMWIWEQDQDGRLPQTGLAAPESGALTGE